MNLGDYFPQHVKDDFAARSIEVGQALFIEIPEFNLPYKKYLIIAAINMHRTILAGVIVNTEINQNIARSKQLQSFHLLIKQADHPFLQYDSYVNCSTLHKRTVEEVGRAISANPAVVVGNVTADMLRKIHAALTDCREISRKDKNEFGFTLT